MRKTLSGIRVYDASQGVAGPHATMLLALQGADVLKVEPLEGDWCRVLGKKTGQHCAHSLAFNRGKRSIAFNIKSEAGREIARRLVEHADVFVESFRPGVAEKIGLGYRQLSAAKPSLVYASVSGFGQVGPLAQRPTVDVLIQAYSGMMVMNKTPDGLPFRQGMVTVDVVTGLYAYQAILAAIMHRIRFGEGACLDISMMQSAAAFQAAKIMEFIEFDGKPAPLYVPAGMFRTADGVIVISGMRDAHYRALCEALERPDMAQDPRWTTQSLRVKNGEPMLAELRKEFAKRATDDWIARLHTAGVLAEKVQSYQDWLREDHVASTKAVDWVEFGSNGRMPVVNIPGFPLVQDDPEARKAPLIGEHSSIILNELGFSPGEIVALLSQGSVRESVREDG